MESRQEQLLKLIIENFIETAEPVGSKFLVEAGNLEISDATVRNEMRELEEAGFLTHPHTSAGRIPTELGYKFYVEHLLEAKELSKKMIAEMQTLLSGESDDVMAKVKNVSKFVAEDMKNAVLVAFGPNRVYYTGLSGLFSQPEFADVNQTINVSEMFDRCEELIEEVFDRVPVAQSTTLIGSDNPLGNFSSLVATRFPNDHLFMILGPLRMNYGRGQSFSKTLLGMFNS